MNPEQQHDDLDLTSSDPTLERLREKQRQLKEQLKQLEAKERSAERKIETRRKILAGAVVLNAVADGQLQKSKWRFLLDKYLTTDRDRAVFGLPLQNPQTTEAASSEQPAASQPQESVPAAASESVEVEPARSGSRKTRVVPSQPTNGGGANEAP